MGTFRIVSKSANRIVLLKQTVIFFQNKIRRNTECQKHRFGKFVQSNWWVCWNPVGVFDLADSNSHFNDEPFDCNDLGVICGKKEGCICRQ